MATLRAVQVATGALTNTTLTTLYTVPTGKRLILKFVTVMHASSGTVVFQLRLASLGTFHNFSLTAYPGGGSQDTFSPWIVLNAGDVLQGQLSASSHTVAYVLAGSLHDV